MAGFKKPKLGAPQLAGTYLGCSLIWAWCSDAAVAAAGLPSNVASTIQVYYVVGFFLVSALLIYIIVGSYAKKLAKMYEERSKSSLEVAQRLALAIELRDSHAQGHNHRLGKYCQIIAEEAGLAPETSALMYTAAALHDIGKIGVPDSILNKPGPLLPEERQRIQRHVEIGAALLSGGTDPLMDMARKIVLTHHEAWDGSGYPSGLKGEDIPLEGRIAAVCDMFDALISARPYKEPWSVEMAAEEILRLKGTRFDPRIVEAFERALPKLTAVAKADEPTPLQSLEKALGRQVLLP
jgi:putative two-component system response regulator